MRIESTPPIPPSHGLQALPPSFTQPWASLEQMLQSWTTLPAANLSNYLAGGGNVLFYFIRAASLSQWGINNPAAMSTLSGAFANMQAVGTLASLTHFISVLQANQPVITLPADAGVYEHALRDGLDCGLLNNTLYDDIDDPSTPGSSWVNLPGNAIDYLAAISQLLHVFANGCNDARTAPLFPCSFSTPRGNPDIVALLNDLSDPNTGTLPSFYQHVTVGGQVSRAALTALENQVLAIVNNLRPN